MTAAVDACRHYREERDHLAAQVARVEALLADALWADFGDPGVTEYIAQGVLVDDLRAALKDTP